MIDKEKDEWENILLSARAHTHSGGGGGAAFENVDVLSRIQVMTLRATILQIRAACSGLQMVLNTDENVGNLRGRHGVGAPDRVPNHDASLKC